MHQAENETFHRASMSGGVPSILEPVGVCQEDVKRPDGMTLIPWDSGQACLWDFTSLDTLAPSNLMTASREAQGVAYTQQEQLTEVLKVCLSFLFMHILSCMYTDIGSLG